MIPRIVACRSRLFAMAENSARGRAAASGRPLTARARQFYAFDVHKFAIGVLGASGYAGRELCELVARHPRARLAFATRERPAGRARPIRRRRTSLRRGRGCASRRSRSSCSARCRTARRRRGCARRTRPEQRWSTSQRDLRPGTGASTTGMRAVRADGARARPRARGGDRGESGVLSYGDAARAPAAARARARCAAARRSP